MPSRRLTRRIAHRPAAVRDAAQLQVLVGSQPSVLGAQQRGSEQAADRLELGRTMRAFEQLHRDCNGRIGFERLTERHLGQPDRLAGRQAAPVLPSGQQGLGHQSPGAARFTRKTRDDNRDTGRRTGPQYLLRPGARREQFVVVRRIRPYLEVPLSHFGPRITGSDKFHAMRPERLRERVLIGCQPIKTGQQNSLRQIQLSKQVMALEVRRDFVGGDPLPVRQQLAVIVQAVGKEPHVVGHRVIAELGGIDPPFRQAALRISTGADQRVKMDELARAAPKAANDDVTPYGPLLRHAEQLGRSGATGGVQSGFPTVL